MSSEDPLGDAIEKITSHIKRDGYQIIECADFFESIRQRYVIPSLSEIIAEETPFILARDPLFFKRYDIHVPENPEVALFDLYHDIRKTDESRPLADQMASVYHSAKVHFRHLRYFLIDHPDKKELQRVVKGFKSILEGRIFEK